MRTPAPTTLLAATLTIVCAVPPATLHAETYEVNPGDDWSQLGPRLKAGDEVLLLDGVHVPAAFEGLAGEAGRPIVFRPKDPRALVQIKPDREGIKLLDCRHLRIERIAIRSARRAGVVVEGSEAGRSEDIALHDIYVLGTVGLSEQAGLLATRTDRLDLRRSRFENCAGAAVHLESVRFATLETLQLRASPPTRPTFGLLAVGDCEELDCTDLWIAGEFAVGVSLGAKDAVSRRSRERTVADVPPPASVRRETETSPPPDPGSSEPPAATPAQGPDETAALGPRVRAAGISQCLIRGVGAAFELGSCELVEMRNCSIIEPTSSVLVLVRPPKERPPLRANFRENLVTWRPGSITRFAAVVGGTDIAGLRLGPNLWWSEELPSALPLLGPEPQFFPGTLDVPQTIDLDPALDPRGRTTTPAAKIFGRSVG